MAKRSYSVGKAQQMVLDALGMSAKDHADAKDKFEEIGIVVNSQRQGRKSVPAITVKRRHGGGWNRGGDGSGWREYDDLNDATIDAIEQWIVKDERE